MRRTVPQEEISRPKKRIKRTRTDFISELPDDILLRILSYLPIRDVIRTSSLSHRWRHLSSLLPAHSHLRLGIPITRRVNYIRPSSSDLEAIERGLTSETTPLTVCEIIPNKKPDARHLARWSDALARRGVRELLIDFGRCGGPDASSVVGRCKSLTKLEQRCGWLFEGSQVGCIFLTHLRLQYVKVSDEMLNGLASGCKSLTNLELIECEGFKCLRLKNAWRLKNLSFLGPLETVRNVVERIEIETPNLEVLELRTPALKEGIDVVAPRLRSVHICLTRVLRRYFPLTASGLWKVMCAAAGVSSLKLRGRALECLSQAPIPDTLNTSFINLKRLYVNLVINSISQTLHLAILLQNLSMLEQLNLVITKGDAVNPWATPQKPMFEEHMWRLEESICIRTQLQHVTISSFMGELYEMSLSSFMLSRARVLKKMIISLSKECTDECKLKADSLYQLFKASPKAKLLIKNGLVEPIP